MARILNIYIEEAHALDEWRMPESAVETQEGVSIPMHNNINDRLAAAKMLAANKTFADMELVCDSMSNEIYDRYDAWPERLYIILDGVVVYKVCVLQYAQSHAEYDCVGRRWTVWISSGRSQRMVGKEVWQTWSIGEVDSYVGEIALTNCSETG